MEPEDGGNTYLDAAFKIQLETSLPNKFHWEGHSYTARDKPKPTAKQTISRMYRCSRHQSTKCKGSVVVHCSHLTAELQHVHLKCDHSCEALNVHEVSEIFDATSLMQERIAIVASAEPTKTAKELAINVRQEFKTRFLGQPTLLLNLNQLESAVYRARKKEFGDWESLIRSYPLMLCSPTSSKLFFQFMLDFVVDGAVEKMVGWAHPQLLFWLAAGMCHLFVDMSFYMVPTGFQQLMVIMLFSHPHQMYIPIWFILLQSKKEATYVRALNQAIKTSPALLNAVTITSDFEKGLLNAVHSEFPSAIFIGCLFHFKQALWRKLIDLGIPEELVHELMSEGGLIGLLTVIPIDEIISKGIPYIRLHFKEGKYKGQFDVFWTYFVKTWIHKNYNPKHWNIYDLLNDPVRAQFLIQRTNNPVENFNRRMCKAFPTAHPPMPLFVETIAQISCQYVDDLDNVYDDAKQKQQHKTPVFFTIPPNYATFHAPIPKKTKLQKPSDRNVKKART